MAILFLFRLWRTFFIADISECQILENIRFYYWFRYVEHCSLIIGLMLNQASSQNAGGAIRLILLTNLISKIHLLTNSLIHSRVSIIQLVVLLNRLKLVLHVQRL